MDAEVVKVANSAWQHDAAGMNFFSRPRVMLDHDTVDTLAISNPDAMVRLIMLQRYHGGNDRFVLAKPMAARMGWTLPRWRAAREHLERTELIRCVHRGGRGPTDPPIYGWAPKG